MLPRRRRLTGCPAPRLAGVLALVVLLVPGWARGQQGSKSSVAEALFQAARKLTAEQRFAEACPKFAESHRLEPALGTLLNLAVCHAAEGKTASAWSELTRALAQAQRENRSDAIEYAQAQLDELSPKLSKLVIKVAAEHEVAGLEVRLDGQVLGRPVWGVAAPVDPGPHSVRAAAPGYAEFAAELSLSEGQSLTQAIPKLVELPKAAEPAPVSPPPPSVALPRASFDSAPQPRGSWSTQQKWALGAGAAGAAGMAVSLLLALSAKSTFDEAAPYCDSSGCDDAGLKLRHDAVVRGRIATVVFGVGAAALAGGGVLWLTAPSPSRATTVSLGVGAQAVAARVTWR